MMGTMRTLPIYVVLNMARFGDFLIPRAEFWRWEMSVSAQPHPDTDPPLIPHVSISRAYDDSIAKACVPLATASDTKIVLLMQLSTGQRMKRQPVFWFRCHAAKTPFDKHSRKSCEPRLAVVLNLPKDRLSFRAPTPLPCDYATVGIWSSLVGWFRSCRWPTTWLDETTSWLDDNPALMFGLEKMLGFPPLVQIDRQV